MRLENVEIWGNLVDPPAGSMFLTARLIVDNIDELREASQQELLLFWVDVQQKGMAMFGTVLLDFYKKHPTGVTVHALPPRVEINIDGPGSKRCCYTVVAWALAHREPPATVEPPPPPGQDRLRLATMCGCLSDVISAPAPLPDFLSRPTHRGLRSFRLSGRDVNGTAIYREQ